MNCFKRSGTAIALVMASAFPAFAQDATILMGVEGTDTIYRVDADVAAELCGISEERMGMLAAQGATIYCTAMAANTADIDFENDDRFVMEDFAADTSDEDTSDEDNSDDENDGADADMDNDADNDGADDNTDDDSDDMNDGADNDTDTDTNG